MYIHSIDKGYPQQYFPTLITKCTGAFPGFGRGGGQEYFFSDLESHALCYGGSGACPPEKIF